MTLKEGGGGEGAWLRYAHKASNASSCINAVTQKAKLSNVQFTSNLAHVSN